MRCSVPSVYAAFFVMEDIVLTQYLSHTFAFLKTAFSEYDDVQNTADVIIDNNDVFTFFYKHCKYSYLKS